MCHSCAWQKLHSHPFVHVLLLFFALQHVLVVFKVPSSSNLASMQAVIYAAVLTNLKSGQIQLQPVVVFHAHLANNIHSSAFILETLHDLLYRNSLWSFHLW